MDIDNIIEIQDRSEISIEHVQELTAALETIPKHFIDTTEAVKGELEAVISALSTWEKMAPKLYFMKKRLLVCEEILSGKRDVESISALPALGEKPEKKKRKESTQKKVFIRRKSEILNDSVIGEIKKFISSDEEYHKSKDIYFHLINNDIIKPFPGDTPDRAFAIALSRVDQDEIRYNNHYATMAWGLLDFGTPEHARRKTLKNSVRSDGGSRVSSYGKKEEVVAA